MRQLITIGHDEAAAAIEAVRAALLQQGLTAVIAVADMHGELVALLRLDGVAVSSVRVAANKAYTAARLRKPSRAVGAALRDPVRRFDIAFYQDPAYVGWGGGLPILVDGQVVGAVGVSGLSEDDDEAFARIGVEAALRR